LACLVAGVARYALAQAMIQLDPFVQATRGDAGCPVQGPPLLAQQQAQAEAHVRVERGLRCAMEGTCEPGGAYRRDAEINEQVRASIAGDRRFADTSVWITTSRKWVTLQGCVRRNSQRRALVALVARSPHVERVFDELKAGTRHNTR
jgi:osmotically-inducible protein OsmY